MRWFFIEPIDVLLFKDARPFGAGTSNAAVSIFPPWPSSLTGALRAAGMAHAASMHPHDVARAEPGSDGLDEVHAAFGTATSPGSLRLCFASLARLHRGKVEAWLRAPLDLLRSKDRGELLRLGPASACPWPCAAPEGITPLWVPKAGDWEPIERFVPPNAVRRWQRGSAPEVEELKERGARPVVHEPRVGIALNPETRTTQRSALYNAVYARLRSNPKREEAWGLLVGVTGDMGLLPKEGWLSLGGDSKPARMVEVVPEGDGLPMPAKEAWEGRRASLCLITPWFVSDGLIDVRLADPSGSWEAAARLKHLVAARPLWISGWDLAGSDEAGAAGGSPRDSRQAAPPGTVLYIELEDASTPPPGVAVQLKGPRAEQGFGLAIAGRWPSNSGR